MKTAIYIEDGVVQLVLTPESDFEKNAIKSFRDKPMSTRVFDGTFYDCRGGWTRQTDYFSSGYYGASDRDRDSSLILRIEPSLTNAQPPQSSNSNGTAG